MHGKTKTNKKKQKKTKQKSMYEESFQNLYAVSKKL